MPALVRPAMKVIKSPKAGKKTKRFKCSGCRATLEVGGKDLKFQADPRDGNAYSFTCPECKQDTWIAADLIPQAMRPAARG